MSWTLSHFDKSPSAGLSKLPSTCQEENFRKILPRKKCRLTSVDFAWKLSSGLSQLLSSCEKKQYNEKHVFSRKYIFYLIFSCEQFLLDFWRKRFGSILKTAFYVSQKPTAGVMFVLKSFFWVCFGFLSTKESNCWVKIHGKVVKTAI